MGEVDGGKRRLHGLPFHLSICLACASSRAPKSTWSICFELAKLEEKIAILTHDGAFSIRCQHEEKSPSDFMLYLDIVA